jgi:hypothetical protein
MVKIRLFGAADFHSCGCRKVLLSGTSECRSPGPDVGRPGQRNREQEQGCRVTVACGLGGQLQNSKTGLIAA